MFYCNFRIHDKTENFLILNRNYTLKKRNYTFKNNYEYIIVLYVSFKNKVTSIYIYFSLAYSAIHIFVYRSRSCLVVIEAHDSSFGY